jgi:hypothetical protein
MRKFWMVLALLLSMPAWAQEPDLSEGQNGDFGGKIFATTDPEGFWTQWAKPENPTVTTTSRVAQGRPVYVMIVFHDCAAAADGKCNVTAHFEIRRPDGKLYDDPKDGPAWTDKPAPGHNLLASLASMGFRLEAHDPLGRYQVTVTLTDQISHRAITMQEYITAVAEDSPPTT